MIAIALALASSLVYGGSDFLGGLKSRTLPLVTVLLVSQGTALAVLVIAAVVINDAPPASELLGYAVLAGVSEAVGVAGLYRGLAVGTMSVVTPIAATAPVVPVIASSFIGELPSPLQGVGIGLAIAGVTMIVFRRSTSAPAQRIGMSVAFGLFTAVGFGGFLIAMDAASEGGVTWRCSSPGSPR